MDEDTKSTQAEKGIVLPLNSVVFEFYHNYLMCEIGKVSSDDERLGLEKKLKRLKRIWKRLQSKNESSPH